MKQDHTGNAARRITDRPHLTLVHGTTPRPAQDPRVITITFDINAAHGPAFRSALEEITDAVATRVEGKFMNPVEQSLANALVALGQLRAAVSPHFRPDPNYRGRRG